MTETQFQKDCKDEGYCVWANCHCAFRQAVWNAQKILRENWKTHTDVANGIERLNDVLIPRKESEE
jgi:hypothetical protein